MYFHMHWERTTSVETISLFYSCLNVCQLPTDNLFYPKIYGLDICAKVSVIHFMRLNSILRRTIIFTQVFAMSFLIALARLRILIAVSACARTLLIQSVFFSAIRRLCFLPIIIICIDWRWERSKSKHDLELCSLNRYSSLDSGACM